MNREAIEKIEEQITYFSTYSETIAPVSVEFFLKYFKELKSLLQTGDICKACDSVLVDDQASCDSCGADICDNCEVVDNVNHTGNFCQKCCTAKNDGEG